MRNELSEHRLHDSERSDEPMKMLMSFRCLRIWNVEVE